jgi:hypothetical protein
MLQKIASLTTIFTHKTSGITDEEFATLVAKLSSSYVGIMVCFV